MSESQPPSYESSESGTSHPSESHQPAAGTTGTGLGERFMGAMGAIHGAGENLRGNVIGALDTLFGGKQEEEAHRVAQRGQEEMHLGVQRMRGRSRDTRGTAAAEGQPQPQGQEPSQRHEQAPLSQEQQRQPQPQAQGQGQPQREALQTRVEEPVQAKDERQVQQEPPQPVSQKAGGERPEQTTVDVPSNVDSRRDEQKIPATSS